MRKLAILKAAAMAAITATVASPVSANHGAERGYPVAKLCARHDAMTKYLPVSYAE